MSSLLPPTTTLLGFNLGSYCDLPTFIIYVIAVVQLPDGSLQHFGNPELGFSAFKNLEQAKRRSSLDWVPVNPLPKEQAGLSTYFKNQTKVRSVAGSVLKHFMSPGQG